MTSDLAAVKGFGVCGPYSAVRYEYGVGKHLQRQSGLLLSAPLDSYDGGRKRLFTICEYFIVIYYLCPISSLAHGVQKSGMTNNISLHAR